MKKTKYEMPTCEVVTLQLNSEYLEGAIGGQSKVPVGGQTDDEEEDPEVDDMY